MAEKALIFGAKMCPVSPSGHIFEANMSHESLAGHMF
jgi:hypothetical protein